MHAGDGWRRTELKNGWSSIKRPYLVVATKTDKLNQSELQQGLDAIRKIGPEPCLSRPSTAGE